MTELCFRFQRRFRFDEDPHELYESALQALNELPPPWGLRGMSVKRLPPLDGVPSTGVSLVKQQKGSPIRSFHIGYKNRNRLDTPENISFYDDLFTVDFYSQKVEEPWNYFVTEIFPVYVRAFQPYIGILIDPQLFSSDMGTPDFETGDFAPNPNWVDSRKGVYRVWPINYWDEKLCMDSWGLTPDEIISRLQGAAYCKRLPQGVIVAAELMDMPTVQEIALIHEVIQSRLIA